MIFIKMESNKGDLRETSKLNPTRWGSLCILAKAAIPAGVKDGVMALWGLDRGKRSAESVRRGRWIWTFVLRAIGSHG